MPEGIKLEPQCEINTMNYNWNDTPLITNYCIIYFRNVKLSGQNNTGL